MKKYSWQQLEDLAKLLRSRKPIPDEVADWLADAIDVAVGVDADDPTRVLVMGHELGLLARNRQPVEWAPQDAEVERDFGDFSSQNKAAEYIAELAGVSKSTAINLLKKAGEGRKKEWEEGV